MRAGMEKELIRFLGADGDATASVLKNATEFRGVSQLTAFNTGNLEPLTRVLPWEPRTNKPRRAGDLRAVEILAIILRDEVGHVAIGNHWYRWLCQRDGLDPVQTYDRLAREHHAPRLRGPLNIEARPAAGFTHGEKWTRSCERRRYVQQRRSATGRGPGAPLHMA